MGDGWVDPYIQTCSDAPFLYDAKLITKAVLDEANSVCDFYRKLVDAGLWDDADDLENILLEYLVLEAGNVDVYDIRYKADEEPTDPYDAALQTYLASPTVKNQLHVSVDFKDCATAPYFALLEDIEQSVENLLPDLLTTYQVLNYNGNKDLICNYYGTTWWTNDIPWPGQTSYTNAKNQTWTVNGATAGTFRYSSNLTHVIVNDAGHMSPFNQPLNTQSMLYRFIAGGFKS